MESVESSTAGRQAVEPKQPLVHTDWEELVPGTRVVGLKVASVL
jgi:hypothetical protein